MAPTTKPWKRSEKFLKTSKSKQFLRKSFNRNYFYRKYWTLLCTHALIETGRNRGPERARDREVEGVAKRVCIEIAVHIAFGGSMGNEKLFIPQGKLLRWIIIMRVLRLPWKRKNEMRFSHSDLPCCVVNKIHTYCTVHTHTLWNSQRKRPPSN